MSDVKTFNLEWQMPLSFASNESPAEILGKFESFCIEAPLYQGLQNESFSPCLAKEEYLEVQPFRVP